MAKVQIYSLDNFIAQSWFTIFDGTIYSVHTHTEQELKQGYTSILFLTSESTKAASAHDLVTETFGVAQQGSTAAGLEQPGRAVSWLQASAYGTGELQRESPSVCTAPLPARAAGGRIQPGCGWRCSPTAGGNFKTWTSFAWTWELLVFWMLSGLWVKQFVKVSAVKALQFPLTLKGKGESWSPNSCPVQADNSYITSKWSLQKTFLYCTKYILQNFYLLPLLHIIMSLSLFFSHVLGFGVTHLGVDRFEICNKLQISARRKRERKWHIQRLWNTESLNYLLRGAMLSQKSKISKVGGKL